MVDKGNVDKHRYRYTDGIKAQDAEKWGRSTARSRYGALDYESKPPPQARDACYPQRLGDPNNLQDRKAGYPGDSAMDWKRGANETAENMPNFQRGYRGKVK